MKTLVSYSNCQGGGIIHFLRKTRMAEEYNFIQCNNWQYLMNEANPDDLIRDASKCDVFLYQPTAALKHGMLSTEEMIESVVPKSSVKISFSYCLNHGFFPIVNVGKGPDGWWTGERWKARAKFGLIREVTSEYFAEAHFFDCARRFIECLAEQSRREQETDIKMVPFILENYRKRRLFLTYNHPTSALFEQLTRQIIALLVESESLWECVAPITTENRGSSIADRIKGLSWSDDNEANMNGVQPVHPAVCRELGLEYQPTDNAIEYYQGLLEQMMRELR